MKCNPELLSAYYDGELPAEERLAVAGHVEGCAECADVLAAYRRASAELKALPRVPVPASLNARIHTQLDELSGRRAGRAAWWWGRASGLGLVAAAAIFMLTLSALLHWYDPSALTGLQQPSLAPGERVPDVVDAPRDGRAYDALGKAGQEEVTPVRALAAVPAAPAAAGNGGEPAGQPGGVGQPGSGTGEAPARSNAATKSAAQPTPGAPAAASAHAPQPAPPTAAPAAAAAAAPSPAALSEGTGATAQATAAPGQVPTAAAAIEPAPTADAPPSRGDGAGSAVAAANRRALGTLASEPTPVVVAQEPTATAGEPGTLAGPGGGGGAGAAAASAASTAEATAKPDRPLPSATAQARGSAGKCVDSPVDGLGRVYAASETVRERLGCAISAEQQVTVTEQAFERGYMFRRGDSGAVYLLAGEARTWTEHKDGGPQGETAETGIAVPPDAVAPGPHFGQVWRSVPEARDFAGWGVSAERSFGGMVVEFQHGMMLWSNRRVVYALYSDGTWQDFPDSPKAGTTP